MGKSIYDIIDEKKGMSEEELERLEKIKEKFFTIEEVINNDLTADKLLHPLLYNKRNEKKVNKLLNNLKTMMGNDIFDKNLNLLFSNCTGEMDEISMYVYPRKTEKRGVPLEFLNDSYTRKFTLIIETPINGSEEVYEYSKIDKFIKEWDDFSNKKYYSPKTSKIEEKIEENNEMSM